jgi:FkbM family methyltransferase
MLKHIRNRFGTAVDGLHSLTNAVLAGRKHGVRLSLGFRHGRPSILLTRDTRELHLAFAHAVYVPDVAREFDLYFSAVVAKREGSRFVVDYSRPSWHDLAGSTPQRVWLPSFTEENAYTNLYLARLRIQEGDAVLDLGANCGLFSLACSRIVGPSGLVIAVEPDPTNCHALRQNIHQAGLKNVRVVQAAVWASDGTVTFGADGSMGALVLGGQVARRGARLQLPSKTIDSLAALTGGRRLSAVKVDIEGAEYEALQAASGVIKKAVATWLVEVHADDSGALRPERLERVFSKEEYLVEVTEQSAGHSYPLLTATPRC